MLAVLGANGGDGAGLTWRAFVRAGFLVWAQALVWLLCAGFASLAMAGDSKPPRVSMPETQRTFFKQYCVRCHNAETTMGQVRLDTLPFEIKSVETAERWQKVLDMLNAGEMPPDGEKQPSNEERNELQIS